MSSHPCSFAAPPHSWAIEDPAEDKKARQPEKNTGNNRLSAVRTVERKTQANVIRTNFGQGSAEERSGMKKRLKKLFDNLAQNQQDAVEKLLELPPDRLEEVLDKALSEAFEDAAQATQPPTFEEIADQYSPYPAGQQMTVESITAHLEDQLGPHLKAFDAPENHIYLNEFQKIEPQWKAMYNKLRYEHGKDAESPLLRDLIPKVSVRVDKEVKNYRELAGKDIARIGGAKRYREETKKPEAAIG